MELTMRQILAAVPAINKLLGAELPLRTAHRLFLMADGLNLHLEFFDQKREALAGKDQAEERFEELLDYQVELDAAPVEIPLSADIRLSAGDIQNLHPFVRFSEEVV